MPVSVYLGEYKPEIVQALFGKKYTANRAQKDHDLFKAILGKHYHTKDKLGNKRAPKFDAKKISTPNFFAHHFSHSNPKAAIVTIRRRHVNSGDTPVYHVRVKMRHPTKEGKFIYNRRITTSDPAKHLNRMLSEARWSQDNNKQFRKNYHEIADR